ncbi:MAG: hypothetical protein ACO3Y3_05880 [Phycisphaerales bacterium]
MPRRSSGPARPLASALTMALAFVSAPVQAAMGAPPASPEQSEFPPSPEATRFFERLVERYRELIRYADSFLLEQRIGSIDGDADSEVRTRVSARSRIAQGAVEVSTRTRRAVEAVSGDRTAESREVDLAIAPHLGLRLLDEPLRDFRPGTEGFRATSIKEVEHDRKSMLRIELRSGGESPGEPSSVFGLTVDPNSMLIRKVDGEERLADGRSFTTTISIEPEDEAVVPSEVPPAPPAIEEPPIVVPGDVPLG